MDKQTSLKKFRNFIGSTSEKINGKDDSNLDIPRGWGARHTFVLLSFVGFANVFAMRVNLSIAIVAMVKSSNHSSNHSHYQEAGLKCHFNASNLENEPVNSNGDFNWDGQQQGQILGSLFYGNVVSQLPSGILAERIGAKWIFFVGVFMSSVLTNLTPLAAAWSYKYLMATRAAIGFFQGATFPAMFVMISNWIPQQERSRLGAVIWSGIQFGTFSSLMLSGFMVAKFGWSSVFYFFGSLGIISSLLFVVVCYECPTMHPKVTPEELAYIQASAPGKKLACENEKLPFPPLRKMLTSLPIYALIIAHVGNNWGMYTLITEMPTYLDKMLHVSLASTGVFSALPYFLMWIFALSCGIIADMLIRGAYFGLSTQTVRKLFNTIGHIGPAIGLIGLSYSGCNHAVAIFWLCVSVMLNGATYSGFQANHVELTSYYAGTVMGITNTLANVAAFAAPSIVGVITNGNHTFTAWKTVFLTASGIYIFDAIIFVVFGSSKRQSWGGPTE